jgi:hypothetical protein
VIGRRPGDDAHHAAERRLEAHRPDAAVDLDALDLAERHE